MAATRKKKSNGPRILHEEFGLHGSNMRPQGAPRGLLFYYILHKVAEKPTHGYEILQDIDSKTEGGWRPGPGSIYPMLKKLVTEGLIKSDSAKGTETSQRVYHIAPAGQKKLCEAHELFSSAGKKWSSLRRIFVEMMDPKDLAKFFVDGSRTNFQMAQEIFESKMDKLPEGESKFILREYALILERQLDWSRALLKKKDSEVKEVIVN